MKTTLVLVFIVLSIQLLNAQENPYAFMETNDGIIFINNEDNVNYTIHLYGDSIKLHDSIVALEIDDKHIQIENFNYSREKYSPYKQNEEVSLLKEFMINDKDYFEAELFQEKLDTLSSVFSNKVGKQFLLWGFKMPPLVFDQNTEIVKPVTYQYYLNFIAKKTMCSISFSYYDTLQTKHLEYIQKIADDAQVFGAKIDLDALWKKTNILSENDKYIHVDSINNYKCQIFDWCNIIEINSQSVFGFTAPDILNTQNAIVIFSFPKSKFDSFNDFNDYFITSNKMDKAPKENSDVIVVLMKQNKAPENCNGLDYMIYSAKGGTMFYSRYLTFKNSDNYILVKFVATQDTYDLNAKRFEDFISTFELIK